MQVKKFEAPTIQEALEHIKRDLGPEAIILQTKRNKKGFGLLSKSSVEITAAVSGEAITKKKSAERVLTDDQQSALSKMSASKQKAVIHRYGRGDEKNVKIPQPVEPSPRRAPSAPVPRPAPEMVRTDTSQEVNFLRNEILRLRQMVSEVQKQQRSEDRSTRYDHPAFNDAFDYLILNGMNRKSAWNLIKKAAFELDNGSGEINVEELLSAVAEEIAQTVQIANSSHEPRTMVCYGGAGTGKTTVTAKIAAHYIRKGVKVGLIGVGQGASLEVYAKALGIPYRSAEDAESIRNAQEELKPLDLILVDMPSREELPDVLSVEGRKIEHIFVLSANVNERDNTKAIKHFREKMGLDSVVITKVDESSQLGGLFGAIEAGGAPICFYSNGQQVPESLKEASKKDIVSMIMDL